MEKLKEQFEALLKSIHDMRPVIEEVLQEERADAYANGFQDGVEYQKRIAIWT